MARGGVSHVIRDCFDIEYGNADRFQLLVDLGFLGSAKRTGLLRQFDVGERGDVLLCKACGDGSGYRLGAADVSVDGQRAFAGSPSITGSWGDIPAGYGVYESARIA